MLADAHMHLFDWDDQAVGPLLERARQAGVSALVTLGVTPRTSQQSIQQAKANPMVHAGVGIHPWWVKGEPNAEAVEAIRTLARDEKVCFVGEIGLDAVQNQENFEHQQEVFKLMVRLAKEVNLPINVHGRGAHQELQIILRQEGPPPRGGIIHSFNGTLEEMKGHLDLGMYISLGLQVYRKMEGYEDIVKSVPEDRMVVETDANQNIPMDPPLEPAVLGQVAREVASLRGMSLEALAEKTTENLERLAGALK